MNTNRIAALAAAALLALGLTGCAGVGSPAPAPTSTYAPVSFVSGEQGEPFEKVEPTPEPVVEAPPAPVEEAPAPAPVEEAAPAPAPDPAPAPAPAPPAPVRCPAGSWATASDGYNDTACLPEICFSVAVPDPAHPECDSAFRP